MENPLHAWFQQIQGEARKKRTWALLVIAFILDRVWELLEHRFYQTINDWLDTHLETTLDFVKPALGWFLHSPFTLLILTVCGILVHAYWKSQQERKEEKKEINRQENQSAFVAEIVAKTLASIAHKPLAESMPESTPVVTPSEEPRIYLGIQDEANQVFPGAQLILSNHGNVSAHNIQIQPFKLCRKSVAFPNVPYIHPTKEYEVQATVSDSGAMLQHNIFYWLNKDWDGGGKVTDDWPVDVLIRYNDPSGRRFEATLTMLFHPITHMMNQKIRPDAPAFLRRQPRRSLEFVDIKHHAF